MRREPLPAPFGPMVDDDGRPKPEWYNFFMAKSSWAVVGEVSVSNQSSMIAIGLEQYRDLRVTVRNLTPTAADVDLCLELSSTRGSSFHTTNYVSSSGSSNKMLAFYQSANPRISALPTDGGVYGAFHLCDFNAARPTRFAANGLTAMLTSAALGTSFATAAHKDQIAMNAFRLYFSAGSIASGSIMLEGMT